MSNLRVDLFVSLICRDKEKVLFRKNVGVNYDEPVYKRAGQALSSTSLVVRILRREYSEIRVLLEDLVQLGDIDFSSVIQACV